MKKLCVFLTIIMIASLMLSFAACGGTTTPETSEPQSEPASQLQKPVDSAEPSEEPSQQIPSDEPDALPIELEQPQEPAYNVTYPVEGGYELLMVNVYNPNASAVYGNGTYADSYTYSYVEEATGIKVNFKMLPEATHKEQLDLMCASGDLPDLFGRSIGSYDDNLLKAIEDEIVIDIRPYMEEYAPDWCAIFQSDERYSNNITNSDGSICRIPGRNLNLTTMGTMIRGDWLDALGLEVPKTIDDLTNVLRAFKVEYDTPMAILINSDLDCGLAGVFNSNVMGINMISFQQSAPNSGEVICSLTSEGYIEYLLLLCQYFEEGLINDDFLAIHKNNNNYEPYYLKGWSGVWYDDAKNAIKSNADDPNWTAVAFQLDKSDNHLTDTTQGGGASMVVTYISGGCEIPEVAMQLINFGFTQEGMDLISLGVEDYTYTIDENGKVAYTDLITNNPEGWTSMQATFVYLTDAWMITDQQLKVLEMSVSEEAMDAYDIWTNTAGGDDSMMVSRDVQLTAEEFMSVMEYQNDIVTLFSENAAKVIIGSLDEQGYRDVIDLAYSTGLKEMTAIYQQAFDRYLAENQ